MRIPRAFKKLTTAILVVLCIGMLGLGFFGSADLQVRCLGSISELDVQSLSFRTRKYALFVCYDESTLEYYPAKPNPANGHWVPVLMRSRLFGVRIKSDLGRKAHQAVRVSMSLPEGRKDTELLRLKVADVLPRLQEDEIDALLNQLYGEPTTLEEALQTGGRD